MGALTTQPINEDPLFQLNLVLFLSFPSPPGGRITPVFYNSGFRILSLSRRISLPLPLIGLIEGNSVAVQHSAKPEAILKHTTLNRLLLIECKKSSFSSTSSTANQAVTLLAAQGNVLRDALGFSRSNSWSSELLYIVKSADEELLSICLQELSENLNQIACSTNPHGVWGLEEKSDGIYINTSCSNGIIISGEISVKVLASHSGNDYRTLYLIPADPSIGAPDIYAQEVLRERIRSSVAAFLMGSLGPKPVNLVIEQFMHRVINVWGLWEDTESKKNLRGGVRHYLKTVLNYIKKKYGVEFVVTNQGFEINPVTARTKIRLRHYFMSNGYRTGAFEPFYEQVEIEFPENTES